ncbi:MAG: hypothetical protein ACLU4N_27570 [Butyricimonas faecihominis]
MITTNWDVMFDHALKRAIENGHPKIERGGLLLLREFVGSE